MLDTSFSHVGKVNCISMQAHMEDQEWVAHNTSNHICHSVTHRSGLAVYSWFAADERDRQGTAAPWDHRLHHTHHDQRHPQDQSGTLRGKRERGGCLLRACPHMTARIDEEWPMCATISATVQAISSHEASQYEVNRRRENHFTVIIKTL